MDNRGGGGATSWQPRYRRQIRVFLIALIACGAQPPPPIPVGEERRPPISIEWRAAQSDGDLVQVTLVVGGRAIALDTVNAATEMEPGTPHTCAVRAAHPLRTEFGCGDLRSFYAAELHGDELVIVLIDGDTRHEKKRVPVYADGLAVKPYAMPD